MSKRKRRMLAANKPKVNFKPNKIVNLHIYSAAEYKEELLKCMEDE